MNKDKCIAETSAHIITVALLINQISAKIIERGALHDASKLKSPELECFAKAPKLSSITYGTKEYDESRELIKPALEHHYANNRHHPEHFPDGVKGMNLVDVVEMLCDWKASSMRHNDGNILKSIELNAKRFDMSDDLVSILRNTAELLEL